MGPELVHKMLSTGVKHGASDIHFRPGAPPLYRVRKQLVPLRSDPLTAEATEAVAKIVLGSRRAALRLDEVQEMDASYSVPGVARFRVNVYRQRGSFGIVLRVIPREIPTVTELGLPAVIASIADNERGLILVTGATGSGKSSTLAAMIRHINESRSAHILTIEDPIEFLHQNQRSSISQRELGSDTASFVTGLRSALRQDPDVILVGEMRDRESIDIALKAAETGHLVLSTLHTTDATKTLGRILGVFTADEQATIRQRLADNLCAVISQRLLPRMDGQGLVAACEVMIVTGTVRDVLLSPGDIKLKDLIEQGHRQHRMQSFEQHLVYLYNQQIVSLEVAKQAASNPNDFVRSLQFT